MANIQLTQELVKSLFDYKDGFLYWKNDRKPGIKAGTLAGYLNERRGETRRCVGLLGGQYFASRIIFLYHKGYLPVIVDHEDRNTLNDKIENLREADRFKNNQNSTSRKNSTSKYLGVCFHGRDKKWLAQIQINGKKKHLGQYETESKAALIYNHAAVLYFGEFANLNIITA